MTKKRGGDGTYRGEKGNEEVGEERAAIVVIRRTQMNSLPSFSFRPD